MLRKRTHEQPIAYTLGHSSRPIEEFLGMLATNQIECVADVRTIPKSRYNPQYGADTLRQSLRTAGISYRHFPEFGGLRKPKAGSRNTGWRNPSFQGYADYMQSDAFKAALDELIVLAKLKHVVIVCAEAVPWRCHRNLIADALTVQGIRVEHILSGTRNSVHKLTAWAKVQGKKITYPKSAADLEKAA